MLFNRRSHQNLQLISSCPLCKSHYPQQEMTVLETSDDAHLIYLHCTSCGSAVVALVILGEGGAISQGLLTDLLRDEVMKFYRGEEVTSDDVIEMHQLLRN
ncbi:MAG: hypothetical protein AB1352_00630 [Patescibacteria group bacterium]